MIYWNIKIVNDVRYFHPSLREVSEEYLAQLSEEFWYKEPQLVETK